MVQARLAEVGKERAEAERNLAARVPTAQASGKDEAAALHQLRAEVRTQLWQYAFLDSSVEEKAYNRACSEQALRDLREKRPDQGIVL